MGGLDRGIRIIAAVVIATLYLTDVISGTLGVVLIIIGVAFLLTSFVGFCPLYVPLRLSTIKKQQ